MTGCGQCAIHHVIGQPADHVRTCGDAEQLVPGDQAVLRMLPARQRFCSDDDPVNAGKLRLEQNLKFAMFDRGGKVARQRMRRSGAPVKAAATLGKNVFGRVGQRHRPLMDEHAAFVTYR